MKRNNSYLLKEIAGTSYLLPYGQMIADLRPGIQINETGVFIWNFLESPHSFEELLSACADYYEVPEKDLCEDLSQFTRTLFNMGILIPASPDKTSESPTSSVFSADTHTQTLSCSPATTFAEKHLRIGGLHLKLSGPEDCFFDSFDKFRTTDTEDSVNQVIRINTEPAPACGNHVTLLRNAELTVLDASDHYILLFPMAGQIEQVTLTKDGSRADFYITLPACDTLREDLFHAIRLVYLYLAQKKNMTAIHSASLLYQGKAWLFSGPSGTGKSTHTNLWLKLYETETKLLNGDLNLLAFENDKPVIYGIPWCGTSGIFDTDAHPLGGIVLLKQAPTNHVAELSEEQKILSVLHRFISPSWTADMFEANLSFAEKLIPQITVCRLQCNMEDDAAHTMKAYIENHSTIS